jgi:hypothetical protein
MSKTSSPKFKIGECVKFIFNGNQGKIAEHRVCKENNEYLVKFKNYNPEWIDEDYLAKDNCDDSCFSGGMVFAKENINLRKKDSLEVEQNIHRTDRKLIKGTTNYYDDVLKSNESRMKVLSVADSIFSLRPDLKNKFLEGYYLGNGCR